MNLSLTVQWNPHGGSHAWCMHKEVTDFGVLRIHWIRRDSANACKSSKKIVMPLLLVSKANERLPLSLRTEDVETIKLHWQSRFRNGRNTQSIHKVLEAQQRRRSNHEFNCSNCCACAQTFFSFFALYGEGRCDNYEGISFGVSWSMGWDGMNPILAVQH